MASLTWPSGPVAISTDRYFAAPERVHHHLLLATRSPGSWGRGASPKRPLPAAGYPMEYTFPATGAIVAIAAGILFGALAAIIPARQAARLEIVQALRYE